MKLEVGMYVRTLEGIMKVIEIKEDRAMTRFVNEDGNVSFINDLMTNPSYDVKELIQKGDYVNGACVWEDTNGAYFEKGTMWVGDVEQGDYLENIKIETIVTREQFEAMQYKVV